MTKVTYATFKRLLPNAVELMTSDGELALLDRTEIYDPQMLDFTDDSKVIEYFKHNPDVIIVCVETDETKKCLVAKRFSFFTDPWFRQISNYKRGEPRIMLIRDINSKWYAYGEIEPGIDGRCEKQSIRNLLKERKIFPLRTPEGQPSLTDDILASASLDDDVFWRLYYPEYELNPGDTVIGCVTGFEYDPDPDNELRTVLLDLGPYLNLLEQDKTVIFPWLGLTSTESLTVQKHIVSTTREYIVAEAGVHSYSILILDDDENEILKPMSSFLKGESFEVVACRNEQEAEHAVTNMLKTPEGKTFDTAIIDIHLTPTGTSKEYRGIRFARWLQERMPRCAVLLISAEDISSVDGGKKEAAGDLQVVDYVHKPISAHRLRQLVHNAPNSKRVFARDLFETVPDMQSAIESKVTEKKHLILRDIVKMLGRLNSELGADAIVVFRMHKISRVVSILAQIGEPFPRYNRFAHALRYSPVRDVCEDEEAWCHSVVPSSRWSEKHRNLLKICDPSNYYTNCVACPLPEPPGDENWYALFGFIFQGTKPVSYSGGFRVPHRFLQELPDAKTEVIRDALALQLTREYASYIAQYLLERRHEETLIRQHPFLMTGMTTSSMGHDLANCLMGTDQIVSSLKQSMTKDSVVSQNHIENIGILENLMTRVIDICNTFSKQARAEQEKPSKVNIVDIILSSCQGVMFETERNKVEIYYHDNPQIFVNCQRGVMERILSNLFLNAVQQIGLSIRRSGMVQVRHFLRDTKRGKEVVIQVYDNGPGIQGFRYSRIFDPGETTRLDGSGMGLTISKEELKKIGGSVRVSRSILFCGSCFEVVLPPKTFVTLEGGKET